MKQYEVTVTGQGPVGSYPDSGRGHYGVIQVRPPVDRLGPGFGRIVLGLDSQGASIEEVTTDRDSTTLLAKATSSGGEADILIIAGRVARLLNDPGQALEMMDESPFPDRIPG